MWSLLGLGIRYVVPFLKARGKYQDEKAVLKMRVICKIVLCPSCLRMSPDMPEGPQAELLILFISDLTVMYCIGFASAVFLFI